METFQHKINLMKHQINTIKNDIESITTDNNNYTTSTHYSTPSHPYFTNNTHHQPYSLNFNKPTIKTPYKHNKNSHSQITNLLSKNNPHYSDHNIANIRESFPRKKSSHNTPSYINNNTYNSNEKPITKHKKGKSVIMPHSSRPYNKTIFCSNYEDIIQELIDITNEHNINNHNEDIDVTTPQFVIENYKRLLKENKMHNEFMKGLSKLYMNQMRNDINVNNTSNNTSIIELWKWINYMSHNNNNNNINKYQQYCEQIMHNYNLQTFHDFTTFINHLLSKSTKNETFLTNIKHLLLISNKTTP